MLSEKLKAKRYWAFPKHLFWNCIRLTLVKIPHIAKLMKEGKLGPVKIFWSLRWAQFGMPWFLCSLDLAECYPNLNKASYSHTKNWTLHRSCQNYQEWYFCNIGSLFLITALGSPGPCVSENSFVKFLSSVSMKETNIVNYLLLLFLLLSSH